MNKKVFIIAIIVLAIDQLSKMLANMYLVDNIINIIPNFFKLEYALNTGAAWSILNNHQVILIIISIILMIILFMFYKNFKVNMRNNIAFGVDVDKIDDDEVWRALKEAQLYDFVKSLPKGLDTMVGERGARISGGQRQRIGIARALYRNPEVLVFDEATSALDNETEREVMEAVNSLQGTKTMIMIAHRLTTVEKCDVIYKIENGKAIKISKEELYQ